MTSKSQIGPSRNETFLLQKVWKSGIASALVQTPAVSQIAHFYLQMQYTCHIHWLSSALNLTKYHFLVFHCFFNSDLQTDAKDAKDTADDILFRNKPNAQHNVNVLRASIVCWTLTCFSACKIFSTWTSARIWFGTNLEFSKRFFFVLLNAAYAEFKTAGFKCL